MILLACSCAQAFAAKCGGNPTALGTKRDLAISPSELSHIGTLQYKQTLPLRDHEVVLTFDDGPLPPYTNIILDILKSKCVKANYFLIGKMAQAFPYLVRRIYDDGHTVGTHSLDHPLAFERLPLDRMEYEVKGGIAAVDQAMGDSNAVAPFFRIPGFGRSEAIDSYLASQSLVTWSTDVVADDWLRNITPDEIVRRAMTRLDEKGKGVLLLHDIHPATVMALPGLLAALKGKGYSVVHVVPDGQTPKSVSELPAPSSSRNGLWPRVILSNISSTPLMHSNNGQIKKFFARKIH